MDFKIKKDDFETKIQQTVDDLRICQIKRNEILKEMEKIKEKITSIKEWNKLWL